MLKHFSMVWLVLEALFVVACASNESPDFTPTSEPIHIDEAIAKGSIECENSSDCHESVGLVLVATRWIDQQIGVRQCTGTLVDEDIVMTNSHCLADSLKYFPEKCPEQLGIMFPATDHQSAENRKCLEILHFSKIAPEHHPQNGRFADYAFFKLDRPVRNRMISEITRSGHRNNEEVVAHVVDPVSSRAGSRGLLRSKKCLVKHRSLAVPESYGPLSDLQMLAGKSNHECLIMMGNSGSPVINAEGKVSAIVHAYVDRDNLDIDFHRRAVSKLDIEIPSKPQHVSVATNLACMTLQDPRLKSSYGEPPDACRKRKQPDHKKFIADLFNLSVRQAFYNKPDVFLTTIPEPYHYYNVNLTGIVDSSEDDDKLRFLAVPGGTCLIPSHVTQQNSLAIEQNVPVLAATAKTNSYWEIEADIYRLDDKSIHMVRTIENLESVGYEPTEDVARIDIIQDPLSIILNNKKSSQDHLCSEDELEQPIFAM